MRSMIPLLTLLSLWLSGAARGQDPERLLEEGRSAFQRGIYKAAQRKYEKAVEACEAVLADEEETPEERDKARRGRFEARAALARALVVTGEYEAGEKALTALVAEGGDPADANALQTALGDLLRTVGRAEEALKAYEAVLARDEEALMARLGMGYALQDLGRRDDAYKTFDWFVGYWARAGDDPGADALESVGRAAIALGVRDQDLYLDAQKILERCEKEFPGRQDARVALAYLYMDRYARAQARPVLVELFKENPNHPEGRAAMAVFHLGGWANKEAGQEVKRALDVNPRHVEALVARAALELADQRVEEARASLEAALAVNPVHAEALSLLAGCRFLRNETAEFEALEKRVFALRPRYGAFYLAVGDLAAMQRRLEESVAFYRKALEKDPQLWKAYFSLGISLSRQGNHGEARAILEKGYAGDRYNVQVHNLLNLFDAYDEHFVTRETEHFNMLFHRSEATVMDRYCGRILEESWNALTKKYGFEPAKPVYSEMFSQHADFAVRTLGFPGLGALGACFGPLITLDSPRARPPGSFNWASTTWHEFAHVVTVQLSKGRVPRWFTEGLSVYEERCGRPYWVRPGHRVLLGKLKAGSLTPLKDLNAQFTRGDVLLAYFHASWVVQFIVETHGFEAVVKMLEAYGRDRNDEQVCTEVLKDGLDGVDAAFKEWLGKHFAHIRVSPLFDEEERKALRLEVEKNPADAALLARYARACLQNGKMGDAEIHAGRARGLDAKCAEASNVLGEIFFLKKRFEASATYFHEALANGAADYNIWLRLAAMAEEKDDVDQAIVFLERARDLFPEYAGPGNAHERLRALYGRKDRGEDALSCLEALSARLESDLKTRLELVSIYQVRTLPDREIRVLRELHEIYPFRLPDQAYPEGYFNTHLRLGRLLGAKGSWEDAHFEAALALSLAMQGEKQVEQAEEVEIRVFLAECLLERGELEEAAAQLDEVLEYLDPGNAAAEGLLKKLREKGK